jgi:hypothetical protein
MRRCPQCHSDWLVTTQYDEEGNRELECQECGYVLWVDKGEDR